MVLRDHIIHNLLYSEAYLGYLYNSKSDNTDNHGCVF